nr:MAG TPA: hypothetical protein [Caudoviricetes sp.]
MKVLESLRLESAQLRQQLEDRRRSIWETNK